MGGMPWWLSSSAVEGGGTMLIRSDDPAYMAHVERFWGRLLPLLAPYLYERGGPIVMMQVRGRRVGVAGLLQQGEGWSHVCGVHRRVEWDGGYGLE